MENSYHPIENVLNETLKNIKNIIDINTVVGDAIQSPNGSVIIPISKISLGYVGGGGELSTTPVKKGEYPFATGTGAGVNIVPIGFLIQENENTKFIQTNIGEGVEKFFNVLSSVMQKISPLIKEKDSEEK